MLLNPAVGFHNFRGIPCSILSTGADGSLSGTLMAASISNH